MEPTVVTGTFSYISITGGDKSAFSRIHKSPDKEVERCQKHMCVLYLRLINYYSFSVELVVTFPAERSTVLTTSVSLKKIF